jgi:hypothetical protein
MLNLYMHHYIFFMFAIVCCCKYFLNGVLWNWMACLFWDWITWNDLFSACLANIIIYWCINNELKNIIYLLLYEINLQRFRNCVYNILFFRFQKRSIKEIKKLLKAKANNFYNYCNIEYFIVQIYQIIRLVYKNRLEVLYKCKIFNVL